MENNAEKLTLLATSIALELAKCKTQQEINNLRFVVGQVYNTLTALASIK